MANGMVLEILKAIQKDIADINSTLAAMRSEIDGQFSLMTSKSAGLEALERLVALHGQRITALERAK